MRRPGWAASRRARRWLVVGAVVLLFLTVRSATQSFGAEATLSDGARALASCKAPWQSARLSPPAHRFTLWAMTGGTGKLREEGVATLGARCRTGARARLGFAVAGLVGSAALAWLALPTRTRRPLRGETLPP